MVFCDLIRFVELTRLPIDILVALFYAVADPVKMHIHCLGFTLPYIVMHNTICCGIVCFKGRAYCWLVVPQFYQRVPAWVIPYIPFLILENTHPSGVTYLFRSYSSMNSWGILVMCIRRYSFVFKSVFKYIFTRSKPHHFAPVVERVLLMSIFAVESSAVGVPTS